MSTLINTLYTTGLFVGSLLILAPIKIQAKNTFQCANQNSKTIPTTTHLYDNKNGTISDSQTGLVWKKCTESYIWDSRINSCIGTSQSYTWQKALQQAKNVNTGVSGEALGLKDWRLPNIKELASIIELSCYHPAINQTVFPITFFSSYWSSSLHTDNASGRGWSYGMWVVDFNAGDSHLTNKYEHHYIRLVRSEKQAR